MSTAAAHNPSFTASVTRFAPSPTGSLHLGNARTALFNFLLARRLGGRFILRIEDTDLERSAEQYLHGLIEDLRWLGITWDEGPDVGGPAAPYRQSERNGIYARYFKELADRGLAYPCFCSPLELELSRKAQLAAGRPPRYAGTCRGLSDEQRRAKQAQGVQPTLRFQVPTGAHVDFEDFVRGPQHFATDDIGDFIVRRADGNPAFFFCNAVDDALMDMTDVLRGEDHLTNTPRQILILRALGLNPPRYGHVALITGPDGAKLSKRHGSVSVQDLRARGFLPEAVVNQLFRLGHASDQEGWLPLSEMPMHFRVDHLGRAPARFDEAQLMHWQKEALTRMTTEEVSRWLGSYVNAGLHSSVTPAFIEYIRHNVTLPGDASEWNRIVHGELPPWSEEERKLLVEAGSLFFDTALATVTTRGADLKALSADVAQATGRKGAALYKPLRVALTGRSDGPELAPLLKLMPLITLQNRLRAAADLSR